MPHANAFVSFLDVLTKSLCYLSAWPRLLRYSWHKGRVDQADPAYLVALHSVHTSSGNITAISSVCNFFYKTQDKKKCIS